MTTNLYGLGIDADFDLHDAGAVTPAPPDVVVTSKEPFTNWSPLPKTDPLLDFARGEDHWYTLVRGSDGTYHFRVPTVCDYTIQPDLRTVSLAMHVDAPSGMDGVMTTGALLALMLYLRGTTVFHGSAVDVSGRGVGFVGHSGQGKTTLATLFCVEGASVVTDDVLVVDDIVSAPAIRRGSRELRLRPGIDQLASQISDARIRTSADERQVIAPRQTAAPSVPLAAIVIPNPTRDGSPMRFERLKPRDAALALLSFPRLMGWRDDRVLATMLADASALARRVPVVVGHIPWGPPFPESVTESLFEYLDISETGE